MIFEKEDRVRVRKDLIVGKKYNNLIFVPSMKKCSGKIVTIMNHWIGLNGQNRYRIKEGGCSWSEKMFEADVQTKIK